MNIAQRVNERHGAVGQTIAETFENVFEQAVQDAYQKVVERARLIASSVHDLDTTICVFSDGSTLQMHHQFSGITAD